MKSFGIKQWFIQGYMKKKSKKSKKKSNKETGDLEFRLAFE